MSNSQPAEQQPCLCCIRLATVLTLSAALSSLVLFKGVGLGCSISSWPHTLKAHSAPAVAAPGLFTKKAASCLGHRHSATHQTAGVGSVGCQDLCWLRNCMEGAQHSGNYVHSWLRLCVNDDIGANQCNPRCKHQQTLQVCGPCCIRCAALSAQTTL
jgi:hypothetical protein